MKKAWNIISTVFVWIMVIVAVCMMVFTIISVNTFNRNDRNIFGYRCYIVLSDSMSATDFNAGDLVLVKSVDPTTLVEGDIIAYQSQNPENYGATVTHKIRAKTVDRNGNQGFITYGTTTNVDDETVVTYPFVLGKYEFALPKVGTFFQFLKTPQGYIICILIPFLLLIIYQGLNCVKIFKMYKAEQMAELQAEKDALEAQRKQSEEMMAQLLAMQQMMAQQGQAFAPPAQPAPEQTQPEAPAAEEQPVAPAVEEQPAVQTPQIALEQEASAAALPDLTAMMAELNALRAQVAAQNQQATQQKTEEPKSENDGTRGDGEV